MFAFGFAGAKYEVWMPTLLGRALCCPFCDAAGLLALAAWETAAGAFEIYYGGS